MDDNEKKPPRGPTLRGAARRVLGAGAGERAMPRTRELLAGILDSSDKVKTEAVRAMGREVRTYLEGLGIDEALMHLLTHYSLEVNASLSLKPLAPTNDEDEERQGDPEERVAVDMSAGGLGDEGITNSDLDAREEAFAVVDDEGSEPDGSDGVDDDVDE